MVTPPLRKRGANRRKAFASPMCQPLILPLRQLPGQTQGSAPTTAVFKYFRQASPTPNWRQYIIRWTSMRQYTTPHEGKPTATGRARQGTRPPAARPDECVPASLLRNRAWPPGTAGAQGRARGGLSRCKRPPLAARKTAFWKAKGRILRHAARRPHFPFSNFNRTCHCR